MEQDRKQPPPPPAAAELPTPVAWSVAFNGRADTDYTYCSCDAAEGAADYLRAHKAELGPFAVVPLYAAPPTSAPEPSEAELPPLPKPGLRAGPAECREWYSASQMREYALRAAAAARGK